MKHGLQKKLAEKTGYSRTWVCLLLAGKRRASYSGAKKLAKMFDTSTSIWQEPDPVQIKIAVNKFFDKGQNL